MTPRTTDAAATDYAPQGAPFTGRKMLLSMLAFYGVIIAVNVTMATAAINSFGGLVVKNAYVASQNFQADIAAAAAQRIAGWRAEFSGVDGAPTIQLTDVAGLSVEGAVLTAVIGRPTHEREDRLISFSEVAPGLYQADASLPAGAWRVSLRAEGAGRRGFDLYVTQGGDVR